VRGTRLLKFGAYNWVSFDESMISQLLAQFRLEAIHCPRKDEGQHHAVP